MKKNFHLILRILRENSFCPKLSTLKLTLFAMCLEKILRYLDFLAEIVLEHYCDLSFFGLEFFATVEKASHWSTFNDMKDLSVLLMFPYFWYGFLQFNDMKLDK